MFWIGYNILFAIGYTLMLPRFILRMLRRGGYGRGFGQRFGRYDKATRQRLAAGNRVWVHAVSVGEVYVALTFMRAVRARHPETAFVLSTTTSTGHAIAEQALAASDDVLLYFPLDFPPIVSRALAAIRPRAIVLVEGEFWPNLIRAAAKHKIPVALVNGRISDGSFGGYRYVRAVFSRAAAMMTALCVQSEQDRDRLVALGAPPDRVHVVGSAKYDMTTVDDGKRDNVDNVLNAAGLEAGCPLLVGGSTWPGEEVILLKCLKLLRHNHPNLALVLVPRHVERTWQIAAELRRSGLKWVLRSSLKEGNTERHPVDVLLVDTTGELSAFYARAALVFVGKSLTQRGGQNMIEPSALGKPVVVGSHTENFLAVMRDFLDADAIVQIGDSSELPGVFERLLADEDARNRMGQRAKAVVESKRGAVARTVDALTPLIAATTSDDRHKTA